jgi:carbamoyltransferase
MRILSILWGTCSTAALMIDGQIVACVSEERFSRRKNDESYPKLSIEYVLNEASLLSQFWGVPKWFSQVRVPSKPSSRA